MPQIDSPKKQALRVAMKNPQLQKVILQAASSPIGSTMRTKAGNILNSLQTTYLNRGGRIIPPVVNLGQGGPADTPFTPIVSATPTTQIVMKPLAVKVDLNAPEVKTPLLPESLRPVTTPIATPNVTYVMPFADEFSTAENAQQPAGWWNKVKSSVTGVFKKKTTPDGQGAGLPGNTAYMPNLSTSPFGKIQLQPKNFQQFDINKLTPTPGGSSPQPVPASQPTSSTAPTSLSPLAGYNNLTLTGSLNNTPQLNAGKAGPTMEMTPGGKVVSKGPNPNVPKSFFDQGSRLSIQLVNGKIVQTGEMPKQFWKYTDNATVYDSDGNPLSQGEYLSRSLAGDWSDIFDAGPDPSKVKNVPTVGTPAAVTPAGTHAGYTISTSTTPYGPPKPITATGTETADSSAATGTAGQGTAYQPTGNALVDYLNENYQQGLGKSAFTMGVMGDADKMSQFIYGKPASQLTPEEAAKLPVGASLSGQLNDLEDSLRKEAHLDEIQNNLTRQIGVGKTLTDDLSAYVRGKDEYLNSIDQMLTKVKDQYLASSMRSDPFYQKSMGQYMDYLTILKGRQTQRYIDFLNTGINYQNAQVGQLQNMYNSLADQVNRAFQQKSAVTTEQYTQIKDLLGEMYDNVTTRTALEDENSTAYWELQKTRAEAIKSIADVENIEKYGSTGKPKEISTADEALMVSQFENIYNPTDAISNPILVNNGYGADSIFNIFQKYRIQKIKEAVLTGNIDAQRNQDVTGISEFMDGNPDVDISNYSTALDKAYAQGIEQYITGNYDAVLQVLKSMTHKKNRNNFAHWKSNNNNQGLTDDITRRLLQLVDNNEQAGAGRDLSKWTASEIALNLAGIL